MGAGGGWWGVGAKREEKERGKRRGGRAGSTWRAWGARGAAKGRFGRVESGIIALSNDRAPKGREKFWVSF